MAISTENPQDVPMSVRMRRVLTVVKRMSTADRFQLLVKAGLMTENEAQQAVGKIATVKKARRKPKARRTTSIKDGAGHRKA